jgi:hypothetical protein
MLTQTMPALIDALRQVLPPEAIGPLAQALGNCAQPLTHRAGLNLPGPRRPNLNGAFGSGTWDPSQYRNLFPGGDSSNAANYHGQVDVGGMNGSWNEGNRYDSQFYFPTTQVFQQNQYFGGPTINNTGGANIDYITNQYFEGDTVNVQNLTTQVINGDPIQGPAGPPGAAGRDGQRGAPGAPGGFVNVLPQGFFKKLDYLSGNPQLNFDPELVARPHRYVKDAWVRSAVAVSVPTNAISGGTVTVACSSTSFDLPTNAIAGGTLTLTPSPIQVVLPTAVTFDPETCTVTVSQTTSVWVFPSEPTYLTLSGEAAATQSVTVASTSSVTATVSVQAASTISVYAATTATSVLASGKVDSDGFLVKSLDRDFWGDTAKVRVARNPTLAGINQANVQVFTPNPGQ